MTVARFAVSFDEKLAKEVRRAAGKQPISKWLADAAMSKLQADGWLRLIEEFESIHGAFTEQEIKAALRRRRRWAK